MKVNNTELTTKLLQYMTTPVHFSLIRAYKTPHEFQEEYQARAIKQGYEILDTTAAQLHDDVWGLALALNATMTMVNDDDTTGTGCENLPGKLVPLEEFTYNNTKMGCLINWNLRKLTFSGVSVSS